MASPQPLWENGPRLKQVPGVFPMGTDSILLADFSAPAPGTVFWIWALALVFCRCCCFTTEPGSGLQRWSWTRTPARWPEKTWKPTASVSGLL